MVPAADLVKLPAGHGRSEPNTNPVLPKPTGRLQLWDNPIAIMYKLLGPDLCRKISGALCCLVLLLITFNMLPVIFGNIVTAPFTGR